MSPPGEAPAALRANRGAPAILAGLLVAVLGGGLAISRMEPLAASKSSMTSASLPLYVPTGRAARLMSVGHPSTLADLLYLWSIQHFSSPAVDPELRSAWLRRVYGTITDLDPRFRDAYWLGYVSLVVEGQDLDGAFALVDKALAQDPSFTMLALEAAMSARKAQRPEDALRYLATATESGDKLALRLLLRLREPETAQEELAAWSELIDDSDDLTRHIARAHVRDLTMFITSAELSAMVQCYRSEHGGMLPGSLQQLVTAGHLRDIPRDPDGKPYVHDVRTGAVIPASSYLYKPPSNSRLGVSLSHLGRCAPDAWQRP